MEEPNNIFSFIDKDFEHEIKWAEHFQVVAYQIMRLQKSTVGGYSRNILDTVYVLNGNRELAEQKAIRKARLLLNCFVIELAERVIDAIIENANVPLKEDLEE